MTGLRETSKIQRGRHVYTHIVVVVARAHALLGKLDLIPRRHKQLVNVLRAPNELGLADKSIRVGGEETKGGLGQASRGGGETSHRGDVGGGGETSEGGGGGGGEGGGEPGTAQVARTGEAAADHTGCRVGSSVCEILRIESSGVAVHRTRYTLSPTDCIVRRPTSEGRDTRRNHTRTPACWVCRPRSQKRPLYEKSSNGYKGFLLTEPTHPARLMYACGFVLCPSLPK